ncbi:hypothetical protein IMZ48_30080 [Candidatus Bathyarchaeota archaeon]|nr:hypothetical protein [Candidatus Bathyarchaeota archaeon]
MQTWNNKTCSRCKKAAVTGAAEDATTAKLPKHASFPLHWKHPSHLAHNANRPNRLTKPVPSRLVWWDKSNRDARNKRKEQRPGARHNLLKCAHARPPTSNQC